jgi:signal transduction histidine kinase
MRSSLPSPVIIAVAAVAGAAACVVTAIVTASTTGRHAGVEVTARVVIVGVPIVVGLLAWRRRPSARFGRNLTIVSFGWFLSFLSASSDPWLYSTGRVFGWIVEVGIAYLILSFPAGRLRDRFDRALVAAAAALAAALYLPTALLSDGYPAPSPWTSCVHNCPANAFQVTGAEPAFIEAWERPLRELATVLVFSVIAVRVAARVARARPLLRRTIAPVLVVATARLAVFVVLLVGRRAVPDSELVTAAMWMLAAALPVMSLAFLVGLVRWRLFIGSALERVSGRAVAQASPEELRCTLAEAFGDPELQILYWLPVGSGCWLDAEGRTVAPPRSGSGRLLTEVHEHGRRVAALVHDDALRDERAFIEAGSAFALATLENQRLSARTAALLREVDESRARIAATADEERRRIERDLHDGAQQRLVALRIRLGLAAELLAVDRARGTDMVRELGADVEAALDEVRALARGVYPAPLMDSGLSEALRSAARQSPLPVTVIAELGRRYPMTIESASYFCCLEAMQNAAKHATGATHVIVTVAERDRDLWLEIADDGPGFDVRATNGGAGLLNMRDRARAVGGELIVDSRPGRGTRVAATIPLPTAVAHGQARPRATR